MKNLGLMLLALVLSAGIISGCAEKKQSAEAGKDTAVKVAESKAVESVGGQTAEVKQTAAAPAADAKDVKDVVESVVGQTADVMQTVPATVADAKDEVAPQETAAPAVVEEAAKTEAAAPAENNAALGAKIFKMQCSPCHGAEGRGSAMAPAFKGNDWIKGADNTEIAGVIKNGRQGPAKRYTKFATGMPPYKRLSDGDVNALIDYLRSVN